MRIAVTSTGPDLSAALDQSFGRAHYLLVVDLPERTVLPVDNLAGMNAQQGAGVQGAQNVINNGATVLLTGSCGPNAFRALSAAGVEVYVAPAGSVADAIDQYEAGDLTAIPAADVDGHG